MKRAETYGRKRGCTVAYLFVDEGNSRGIRFYRRNGYEVLGHVSVLKAFQMHKSLIDHPFEAAL